MKKPLAFVGIDVSKLTLDLCELSAEEKPCYSTLKNDPKSIRNYLKTMDAEQTVIAMENTGRYNWFLYDVLADFGFTVYVINPYHLKHSLGLVRGKTDQVDSYRIAWFIERNHRDLKPWEPESKEIKHLKLLLTERRGLIKQKKQVQIAKKERYLIPGKVFQNRFIKRDDRRLREIENHLKEVETELHSLIKSNQELNKQADLVRSVTGVGKVLCWNLLAKTNAFKTLNDPRKLACFAGVSPFDYQSGTSVKRRPGVSGFADKQLKTLLHMAAMVAIQHDQELKQYFDRKVGQGKNKMTVLNAIRNKLIHRICAVVKNQKPYEKRLVLS